MIVTGAGSSTRAAMAIRFAKVGVARDDVFRDGRSVDTLRMARIRPVG